MLNKHSHISEELGVPPPPGEPILPTVQQTPPVKKRSEWEKKSMVRGIGLNSICLYLYACKCTLWGGTGPGLCKAP